jgi:hypothetical protein
MNVHASCRLWFAKEVDVMTAYLSGQHHAPNNEPSDADMVERQVSRLGFELPDHEASSKHPNGHDKDASKTFRKLNALLQ